MTTSSVSRAIYFQDREFMESEKEHGRYYIGDYYTTRRDTNIRRQLDFILNIAISPAIFLAYPFRNIRYYFAMYRMSSIRTNVDILQLQICEFPILDCSWTGTYKMYYVLIKTHWLRLVQRRWRAVLLARAAFVRSSRALYYREIRGRFPENPHTLRGMLVGLVRKGP